MTHPLPSFAIVGRPNVGKSSLFNRMIGGRRAIVHDTPGVTRDWQVYPCHFRGIDCKLYDTPGITTDFSLLNALSLHGFLWVLDGKEGLRSEERDFADKLRKKALPVLVLINKCESFSTPWLLVEEVLRLGFGDPVLISARHGQGMEDLSSALASLSNPLSYEAHSGTPAATEADIAVVILGRPNAGKSTLVNRFLGYERMRTGSQPGITTDAVATRGMWKDHSITITDTAGLRKNRSGQSVLEPLASKEAYRGLVFAHISIILVDAESGFHTQDRVLLEKAHKEGRGVILALNKWDRISNPSRFLQSLPRGLRCTILPISCFTGEGLVKLWDQVLRTYAEWNQQLATAPLNRWLQKSVLRPPMCTPKIKMNYITQTKSRPPTFTIFGHHVTRLPTSYQRYLTHKMAADFKVSSPRLLFRNTENPYHKS